MYHNLESFRQTRKHYADLFKVTSDDAHMGTRGCTYDDDTLVIYRHDGKWVVTIGSSERTFNELSDAEFYLFVEFYLTECWTWPDMIELNVNGLMVVVRFDKDQVQLNDGVAVYLDVDGNDVPVVRDAWGNIHFAG